MAAITETLVVPREGMTLDLLLWSHYRREVPGLVEQTLDQNPGLPRLGVILPAGTQVVVQVPQPPEASTERVISLWD